MEKVRKAAFMFADLFGLERYDYNKVVSFLVTVKTNYRSVAYHNWSHGFHVCNSIYSILKASPGIFNPVEVSKWQVTYLPTILYFKILGRMKINLFIYSVSWPVGWSHLP